MVDTNQCITMLYFLKAFLLEEDSFLQEIKLIFMIKVLLLFSCQLWNKFLICMLFKSTANNHEHRSYYRLFPYIFSLEWDFSREEEKFFL